MEARHKEGRWKGERGVGGRKGQCALGPRKAVQAGSCAAHCWAPPSQSGDRGGGGGDISPHAVISQEYHKGSPVNCSGLDGHTDRIFLL